MATNSAYENVASDERGHCSWFLARTNKEHQATMEHPFMKSIYAKSFDKKAYVAYLRSQYLIFAELERVSTLRKDSIPLQAVYDESLHRSAALLSDLRFWGFCGDVPGELVPSEATKRYLVRLNEDSSDDWLILCHHFLNYNAVLSGGQFLGGMVAARAGSEAGALFYTFPEHCRPTHARVQQYIESMDRLAISDTRRSRMLECMRAVYTLLLEAFDEVFAMVPDDGVLSVRGSGTALPTDDTQASAHISGSNRMPPPPLPPASRQMSVTELRNHCAMDAMTKGLPLLASVLGRIYDVTRAKDLFGAGAPYEMFTGHDGTYNLAVMSLKKKTLDKFSYDLDDEEKQCLADWLAYFDANYGQPIAQLRGRSHCIGLNNLPRAEKVPFADDDDDDPPASTTTGAPVATATPPASRL